MNEVVVPIDLTEEEKEILAFFSKRQFMIFFPTLFIVLTFVLFGNIPFISGFVDIGFRIVIGVLLFGASLALAFIKLDKYDQFLSEFILTKIKFKRSQRIFYH